MITNQLQAFSVHLHLDQRIGQLNLIGKQHALVNVTFSTSSDWRLRLNASVRSMAELVIALKTVINSH